MNTSHYIFLSLHLSVIEFDSWLRENYGTFLFSMRSPGDISRKEDCNLFVYGYAMNYHGPFLSYKGLDGHGVWWNNTFGEGETIKSIDHYSRQIHQEREELHNEGIAHMYEALPLKSYQEHQKLLNDIQSKFQRTRNLNDTEIANFNGKMIPIKELYKQYVINGAHPFFHYFSDNDFIQKLKQLYGEDEVDDFGRRRSML